MDGIYVDVRFDWLHGRSVEDAFSEAGGFLKVLGHTIYGSIRVHDLGLGCRVWTLGFTVLSVLIKTERDQASD